MTADAQIVLRKSLTANDLGRTGSHQVGIHVPKLLAPRLPGLDLSIANPECWLEVETAFGAMEWRYIYYNKKQFGTGTRDEYRLLHTTGFIARSRAGIGDVLEIIRTGDRSLKVAIRPVRDENQDLVLQILGQWRVVRTVSSDLDRPVS